MENACQLYLVSPPEIGDLSAFDASLRSALGAGPVACFQLRLKSPDGVSASDDEILRAAERLGPGLREHNVAFLINDRPDLALQSGADGVHLGQTDASVQRARAILGDDASIGVTCHNSRHLALEAGEAGADYVAFGAFFPTQTKEAPTHAEPEILEWWAYATTLPSVAIGGVTPENCGRLARAGADFIAVSSAVWRAPEGPESAVKAFIAALKSA